MIVAPREGLAAQRPMPGENLFLNLSKTCRMKIFRDRIYPGEMAPLKPSHCAPGVWWLRMPAQPASAMKPQNLIQNLLQKSLGRRLQRQNPSVQSPSQIGLNRLPRPHQNRPPNLRQFPSRPLGPHQNRPPNLR